MSEFYFNNLDMTVILCTHTYDLTVAASPLMPLPDKHALAQIEMSTSYRMARCTVHSEVWLHTAGAEENG